VVSSDFYVLSSHVILKETKKKGGGGEKRKGRKERDGLPVFFVRFPLQRGEKGKGEKKGRKKSNVRLPGFVQLSIRKVEEWKEGR